MDDVLVCHEYYKNVTQTSFASANRDVNTAQESQTKGRNCNSHATIKNLLTDSRQLIAGRVAYTLNFLLVDDVGSIAVGPRDDDATNFKPHLRATGREI